VQGAAMRDIDGWLWLLVQGVASGSGCGFWLWVAVAAGSGCVCRLWLWLRELKVTGRDCGSVCNNAWCGGVAASGDGSVPSCAGCWPPTHFMCSCGLLAVLAPDRWLWAVSMWLNGNA
jgi:hypothetical protein